MHPDVIGVHDVGVHDIRVWLAMEYEPGVRSGMEADALSRRRGADAVVFSWVEMQRAVPMDVYDFAALKDDAAAFYRDLADRPVVLRGLPGFVDLKASRLLAAIAGTSLRVIDTETDEKPDMPAERLLAEQARGSTRYNVFESPLRARAGKAPLPLPFFARQNLLLDDDHGLAWRASSLVLSAAGTFTSLHVDSLGTQNWMALVTGRKRWAAYAEADFDAVFDPARREFHDPRRHAAESFPRLRFTRRHEHVAEPGELVFIPAGWPHEVTTLERSVGIGGSVINEHQIEQTVRSWRRERSLGLPSLADFPAVLRRQASRHCGDAGRRRVERALRGDTKCHLKDLLGAREHT